MKCWRPEVEKIPLQLEQRNWASTWIQLRRWNRREAMEGKMAWCSPHTGIGAADSRASSRFAGVVENR